jgi:hypothetical protein
MNTQSITIKRVILAGCFDGHEIYRVKRIKVSRWNKMLRRIWFND